MDPVTLNPLPLLVGAVLNLALVFGLYQACRWRARTALRWRRQAEKNAERLSRLLVEAARKPVTTVEFAEAGHELNGDGPTCSYCGDMANRKTRTEKGLVRFGDLVKEERFRAEQAERKALERAIDLRRAEAGRDRAERIAQRRANDYKAALCQRDKARAGARRLKAELDDLKRERDALLTAKPVTKASECSRCGHVHTGTFHVCRADVYTWRVSDNTGGDWC